MNMICHNDEIVEGVMPFHIAMVDGFDNHFSEFGTFQMQGTRPARIEQSIHCYKGLPISRDTGEPPTHRKATCQSPSYEDRMSERVKVRQASDMELRHEDRVGLSSPISQVSEGRLPIGRRLPACPTNKELNG